MEADYSITLALDDNRYAAVEADYSITLALDDNCSLVYVYR